MENNKSICEMLGLTQEELAMLLKVTRSQLSMYELGKRNLPVQAKLKMAVILSHVLKTTEEVVIINSDIQDIEKKKIIAELLFLNKRRQRSLEKKLNALAKKQEMYQAAIRLLDYLKKGSNNNESIDVEISNRIEQKIKHQNKEVLSQNQFELQVQLEALQAAEKCFKNAMKMLSVKIGNINGIAQS